MALTRKMLKAMGIEDEKVDQIIEEHSESVEALKKQRDELRERADAADGLQRRVDELEASLEDDGYKARYEQEHKAFEDFKAAAEAEEGERQKKDLYRKLLADAGIDPKRIDSVLKVSDLSKVTVKDGAIEGADELSEAVKGEWSDFVVNVKQEGAGVEKPPASAGGAAEPTSIADALRQRYGIDK